MAALRKSEPSNDGEPSIGHLQKDLFQEAVALRAGIEPHTAYRRKARRRM